MSEIVRTAVMSPCEAYRFRLSRVWSDFWPRCAWLMLNPSTADAEKDDPTIRRLIAWAEAWGYGGIDVVNVYPFRTSKPAELWRWLALTNRDASAAQAMVDNLEHVRVVAADCALRLVGFGSEAGERQPHATRTALDVFRDGAFCLGSNSKGWPLHPMARGKMRIPNRARPMGWQWPGQGATP